MALGRFSALLMYLDKVLECKMLEILVNGNFALSYPAVENIRVVNT